MNTTAIAIDSAMRFIYNQIINNPIYRCFKARSRGALDELHKHSILKQTADKPLAVVF
jgi:hypothetical protein